MALEMKRETWLLLLKIRWSLALHSSANYRSEIWPHELVYILFDLMRMTSSFLMLKWICWWFSDNNVLMNLRKLISSTLYHCVEHVLMNVFTTFNSIIRWVFWLLFLGSWYLSLLNSYCATCQFCVCYIVDFLWTPCAILPAYCRLRIQQNRFIGIPCYGPWHMYISEFFGNLVRSKSFKPPSKSIVNGSSVVVDMLKVSCGLTWTSNRNSINRQSYKSSRLILRKYKYITKTCKAHQ